MYDLIFTLVARFVTLNDIERHQEKKLCAGVLICTRTYQEKQPSNLPTKVYVFIVI